MKTIIKPLLTGVLATLILILVMLYVTMNFQILLVLGSILYFIGGYLNQEYANRPVRTVFLIVFIYQTLFVLLVLSELPELWYFIPFYVISTAFGLLFKKHKKQILISGSLNLIIMLLVVFWVIPVNLENRLTKDMYADLPEFTIELVDGEKISTSALRERIIVLDFFGTWCKPCIQELKELDEIKNEFDESEVVFFVVNADQGGDTPQKFQAFIDSNNYTFNFGYDHNSKIFKQLNMAHLGLPTLLIIDKEQKIRLQHVGYNPAETNFKSKMISLINELK